MSKKILLFILFFPTILFAQNIRYVKSGGSGTQDGSSWENASADLQRMILASIGDYEVWVAKGTYYPNRPFGSYDLVPDSATTVVKKGKVFTIPHGVKVYGGFPDTGSPSMLDRDWNINETILSGDIGTPGVSSDNSTNILRFVEGTIARVDGFTIRDAYDDGYWANSGGAIVIDTSSPTLANLKITNNHTKGNGAGIFIRTWDFYDDSFNSSKASPLILNCEIKNNTSETHGAGVCAFDSEPTFINSLITNNRASRSAGGMFMTGRGNFKLVNTTVAKNIAGEDPGGIFILNSVKLELINSIVYGNSGVNPGFSNFLNPHSTTTYITKNSIVGGSVNPFVNMELGDFTPDKIRNAFGTGENSNYDFSSYGNIDVKGNSRLVNSKIDIGAIESQVEITEITPTNNVLYVKAGATGKGTGSSWQDAIPDLAEALKWVKIEQNRWTADNILQIWVAKGTYTPKYPAQGAPFSLNANRENTFFLVNNTQLYGGFAGIETSLNYRNVEANPTILSGDIGTIGDASDNVHNLVLAFKLSNLSRLDGFIIKDGNSLNLPARIPTTPVLENIPILRDSGAGLALYYSDINIVNCILMNNQAHAKAGGIYILGGNVSIANSLITGNYKDGIYLERDTKANMINTTVAKNNGIGINLRYQNVFNIYNSILFGNTDQNIYSGFQSKGQIKNTLVNSATNTTWNDLWGSNGGGNLLNTTDPFKDIANNDFRLFNSSPAKDKGNNSLYSTAIFGNLDLSGNNRIVGTIDMGSYELLGSNINTPTATPIQYFCIDSGMKLKDLVVNKIHDAQLNWYESSNSTNRISDQTYLINNKDYYVSQSNSSHESGRISIKVIANEKPIIGTPTVKHLNCYGESNGEIIVDVMGGELPYSYHWSTPNGSGNRATNLRAGSYTITVTDAKGCSSTSIIFVNQPDEIEYLISKTNASSHDAATGTASITNIIGGTSPYTISWSTGATTPTIQNLSEGLYTANITDVNGCLMLASVYVDGPPVPPTGLNASFGNTQNTLSWNTNTETDLKGYKIFASTENLPYQFIATVNSPLLSYTHTDLSNGTTYNYRLKAIDLEGNESDYSTVSSATPKAPQVITFESLATKTYGDADFKIVASTNSNLNIEYTSANTSVATVVDGKLHIVGAGTSVITASQTGNNFFTPAISVSNTLTVNSKIVTVNLIDSATKVYDGGVVVNLSNLNFEIDGIINNDDVSLQYPLTGILSNQNVGYKINVQVNNLELSGPKFNNYHLISSQVNGNIGNIKPAVLTYVANDVQKKYGDQNPLISGYVTGFVNNETLNDVTSGILSFESLVNINYGIGDYEIIGVGLNAQNYRFVQSHSNLTAFKILPRSISVSAITNSKIYGNIDPIINYQITDGNLVNGDAFRGELSREIGENVGNYNIIQNTLNLGENYNITFIPNHLSINKAILTVTANSVVRCFGASNPAFTMSYSGFKFYDTQSNLHSIPLVKTIANSNTRAGLYDLEPYGANSNNYEFNYVNGQITINAIPINSITSNKGNSISKGEVIHLSVISDNGISFYWDFEDDIVSGQNSNLLEVRPLKTTTYTLTVTNSNGCVSKTSITIEVKNDFLALNSENFFTPNGDGINDTWVIHNIDAYPNHVLTIADRNGKVVYKTRNYNNNWDGNFNGTPLAVGTYYYSIQFDENQPNLKVTRGFITIVRNNK